MESVEQELSPALMGLVELLECACAEVTVNGQGEPCFCGLWPGNNVSWDYCGECSRGKCGMVYLNHLSTFPSESFPNVGVDSKCTVPLVHELELGVVRCMPTMDNDGDLPDPADITSAALGLFMDQEALYSAIKCCDTVFRDLSVSRWSSIGPQGGCVGGSWAFTVGL